MSSVIIAGNTSGTITLDAPNVAGTTTLTLPTTSGTIVTTNGSGIASVNGIQFPATQSASADANTLDDYEEGTFTPTISSGITSPTYSTQTGFYVKIGKLVYYHLLISVSSGTLNSSNVQFSGLPFSVSSTDAQGGYWSYSNAFNALGYFPSVYANSNATTINFYTRNGNAVLGTNLDLAACANRFSGCYQTN
jgi:hypothetical protein